jgi:hypothetical protein
MLYTLQTRASELQLKPAAPADYVGLTLQKSPVVYYFLSKGTSLPMRFALRDPRKTYVIDLPLTSPNQAGFWPVRFSDYGIALDPGVQYQWFVTVVQDSDFPSKNLVVGGSIECCSEDQFFIWDGRRCDVETVHAYLKAGIWYDGFTCLSELIEADPHDQSLRRLRYRLLTPSGLMPLLHPSMDIFDLS